VASLPDHPYTPEWMRAEGMIEDVLSRRTLHDGRIFRLEELEVRFPSGATGLRDVVRHPGAVGIIALNDRGEVLLINQWRTALGRVTTEIPAGKLELGEDPRTCALREFEEETGLAAGAMDYLTSITPAAGFCDEVLHIYVASDLAEASGDYAADDDEFIETRWVPLDEAVAACTAGLLSDSKTIIALLMVAMKRVRGEW